MKHCSDIEFEMKDIDLTYEANFHRDRENNPFHKALMKQIQAYEPTNTQCHKTTIPSKQQVTNPFKTCYCCGMLGHLKKDCNLRAAQCHCCGRFGHIKATCWRIKYNCFVCHDTGHLAKMCPSAVDNSKPAKTFEETKENEMFAL